MDNDYYQIVPLKRFQEILSKEYDLSLSDSTGRSLYAICRGWATLARMLAQASVNEDAIEDLAEYWQAQCPTALLACIDLPTALTRQLILTLHKLGPLPLTVLEKIPVLNSEITKILTLDTWFSLKQGVLFLKSDVLSQLILNNFPVPPSENIIESLISTYKNRTRCCDKVITAALLINDFELADSLLQRHSTYLLSQLKLQELKQLTDELDSLKVIQQSQLLFNCACCHFLLGDIDASRIYFRRVLNNLKQQPDISLSSITPENERAAFFAGVVLYARFTDTTIKDESQLSTSIQKDLSINTMSTFLKAYKFSRAGQLDKLDKVLKTGLLRSVSLNEHSFYIVFSMLHFWNLLLSCNTKKALIFAEEVKLYLLVNGVTYKGAHEWFLLMDLLRLRLEGNMPELERLARSYLENSEFSKDSIRLLFLKALLMENNLIHQNTITPDSDFKELLQLHSTSFHLNYWLPVATDLRRTHQALSSGDYETSLSEAGDQMALGVRSQASLICTLKIQLHKYQYLGLYPILEKLTLTLSESSQWLRYYEVLVLKAVYLFHHGDIDKALNMFSDAVLNLSKQNLLGAILDPFLLWLVFLEQPRHFSGRGDLLMLLEQSGLEQKVKIIKDAEVHKNDKLSRREKDVLGLLAQGLKNKDIAENLNLSISTVRTHLHNIYEKFSVNSRAAAIVHACQKNLITLDSQ